MCNKLPTSYSYDKVKRALLENDKRWRHLQPHFQRMLWCVSERCWVIWVLLDNRRYAWGAHGRARPARFGTRAAQVPIPQWIYCHLPHTPDTYCVHDRTLAGMFSCVVWPISANRQRSTTNIRFVNPRFQLVYFWLKNLCV